MSVMEGSLSKWTNVMKGWQYRWFVLDENAGLLSYYTSKEKMMRGVRRGCVRLKGAVIGIDDEDDSTFTITVDHKTFHFQARDAEEREKWVRALEDTILRHSTRMRWDSRRSPPTIRDLDNKVSEADAYLQIMIDQTKRLEDRIPTIIDPVEQEKCKIIHDHANTMLDNIKHSIVLLQIAKNTAYPINGVYQGPVPTSAGGSPLDPIYTGSPMSPGVEEIQSGIELGSECLASSRRQSTRSLSSGPPLTLVVPETSYSSSEGEDDFYDANDAPFSPGSQVSTPTGLRTFGGEETITATVVTSSSVDAIVPAASNSLTTRTSLTTRRDTMPTRDDGTIDYDTLYEDDSEEDASEAFETHGSVISHLISQIKIGMDLTKVVLPTFILERRSLLEMYADYFAHPDLFVTIADIKDPRDRMVQVVRWYLSSYHGGRKSTVAKKPYNPILGEIFQCYWDIPAECKSSGEDNMDKVEDGPIPWCSKDQLTFVSEQVSHHPPISAFYAEHVNKRISFCAHIYTKSKFLGLSVCVHNIGQGIISVIDHDEEYIVTFPNGYGRSILTIPWIELGGSVKIKCPKTGYYADVEFLTKPFYSNKKNKVSADVYGPIDKTPFLKINGEWNGIMEAKWTADGSSEVFIDVSKLSIVKKNVRPITEQEEHESRKLWKEVTFGLRFNDIDRATTAKSELEQKQREEAKDRKECNGKWENKLFRAINGDQWEYKNPLIQRLPEYNTKSKETQLNSNEPVQR